MTHYFTDNRNLKENRKEHSFRFSGDIYTFITDTGVFSNQYKVINISGVSNPVETEAIRAGYALTLKNTSYTKY